MQIHRLTSSQKLPIQMELAWDFFSSPANLDSITPPELGFKILGDPPARMHEGQIICYKVRVAPLVWVSWVTEIKAVEEGRSFIDEQRFGPYAFWHHRHTFESIEGGVLASDEVHYALPFGPFGAVAHPIMVKPKLARIFQFRREELTRRFGALG
jgi:ligand-binding SRPBCC domain-containing protein